MGSKHSAKKTSNWLYLTIKPMAAPLFGSACNGTKFVNTRARAGDPDVLTQHKFRAGVIFNLGGTVRSYGAQKREKSCVLASAFPRATDINFGNLGMAT